MRNISTTFKKIKRELQRLLNMKNQEREVFIENEKIKLEEFELKLGNSKKEYEQNVKNMQEELKLRQKENV